MFRNIEIVGKMTIVFARFAYFTCVYLETSANSHFFKYKQKINL